MNRKIRVITFVLVSSLMLAILSSCGKEKTSQTTIETEEDVTETEIVETTMRTKTTPTPTLTPTPINTATPTSSPTPRPQWMGNSWWVDDELYSDEAAYNAYMTFIEPLSDRSFRISTACYFMFGGIEYYYGDYVLKIYNPETNITESYIYLDGEVTKVAEGEELNSQAFYTYDEFISIPVLIECGFNKVPIVNTVEDGIYYGGIVAISTDFTKALISVGKPITVSAEEYENFDYENTTVQDIIGDGRYYFRDCYIGEDLWFTLNESDTDYSSYWNEYNEGSYRLLSASCNTEVYDAVYVIVDIEENCQVFDDYLALFEGGSRSVEYTGFENSYFCQIEFDETSPHYHSQSDSPYNGWSRVRVMLDPVVVENNTIVSMRLSWR